MDEEDILHDVPSHHNLETYPELWDLYKLAITPAQDVLNLYVYDDIIDLIADFTTWKEIAPGQLVDYNWHTTSWWIALIIKTKQVNDGKTMLRVRYLGWDAKWDEWTCLEYGRVQPLGTHTNKVLTIERGISKTLFNSMDLTIPSSFDSDSDLYGARTSYCDSIQAIAGPKIVVNSYTLTFGTDTNLLKEEWTCHCKYVNKKYDKLKVFNIILSWFCINCGCSFVTTINDGCSL